MRAARNPRILILTLFLLLPTTVGKAQDLADQLREAFDAPPTVTATLDDPSGLGAAVMPQFGGIFPFVGTTSATICTGDIVNLIEAQDGFDLNGDGLSDQVKLTLDLGQAEPSVCSDGGTPSGGCSNDSECSGADNVCMTRNDTLSFLYTFISAEYDSTSLGVQPSVDGFTATLIDTTPGSESSVELVASGDLDLRASSQTLMGGTPFDLIDTDGTPYRPERPEYGYARGVAGAPLTPGHTYTLELTIIDSPGDPFDPYEDSCIVLDGFSIADFKTVDPNPELLDDAGKIKTDYSEVDEGGTEVVGAATDGVTQILLRQKVIIKTPAGTDVIEFCLDDGRADVDWTPAENGGLRLLVDPNAEDPPALNRCVDAPVVNTGTLLEPKYYAFAVYQAPIEFNRGGDSYNADLAEKERGFTFRGRWKPHKSSPFAWETSRDFKVVRPPLVLVHGTWDGAGTWNKSDKAQNPPVGKFPLGYDKDERSKRYWTSRVDYGDYKDDNEEMVWRTPLPLATKNAVVRDGIVVAFEPLHDEKLAVTQADVAGHSQGALLSRIHLGMPWYINKRNFRKGDVRKIVSLDGPFLGTPFANLGVTLREVPCVSICLLRNPFTLRCIWKKEFCLGRILKQKMRDRGQPIDMGVVDDFIMCSPALRRIRSTPVPGHALVGNVSAAHYVDGWLKDWYELLGHYCRCDVSQRLRELYDFDLFDLAVPVFSQQGGLSGAHVHPGFGGDEGGMHLENTTSPDYSEELEGLLNQHVVHSGRFSGLGDEWPSPTNVSPCGGQLLSGLDEYTVIPDPPPVTCPPCIMIDMSSSVIAGQTTPVTITPDPIDFDLKEILINGPGVAYRETIAPGAAKPYSLDLPIPNEAIAELEISASGVILDDDDDESNDNFLFSEDKTLDVFVTAVLDTVKIAQGDVFFRAVGDKKPLTLWGLYNDGIDRDVSSLPGTTYLSSDTAVAIVSSNGEVTANGVGIAAIVAVHDTYVDSILVTVLPGIRPIAWATANDPATVLTDVFLDGHHNRPGEALYYRWDQVGGPHAAITDAEALDTSFFPQKPGTYKFQLVVDDGEISSYPATVEVTVQQTGGGGGRGHSPGINPLKLKF